MRISIFDVQLGQCATIDCPNGQRIMIDTGHNTERQWYPSQTFRGQRIDRLILSNYDEDHLSDLEDVRRDCSIGGIYRNRTVSSEALLTMKTSVENMGNGTRDLYKWMQWTESPSVTYYTEASLGDVSLSHYCLPYGTFNDTNNLSYVTFVKRGTFSMMFPGDIEHPGMLKLLENQNFVAELRSMHIIVAPHHGRVNACCEELFNYCTPLATIISDDTIQYASQENCSWYANKMLGCKTRAQENRKVLTTRSDGHIFIDVDERGGWYITTEVEQEQARLGVQ